MPGIMRDRTAFDTAPSGQVQTDLGALASQIESLISTRNQQVAAAMADFQADGVSEEYRGVETRWTRAATETQQIVHLVKSVLGLDDDTAVQTQGKAQAAVRGIG